MSAIEGGVLDELPLLRLLPDDARAWAIRRFVPTSFPFGSVMAAEGAPADAFYVLVSGRARVVKRSANGDEIPLNVLRAGDSFGEAELLEDAPRPSTVRASSDVLALRLDATDFRALVDAHPDIRTYLELQRKHARLQAFFRHIPAFARLPPAAVAGVALAELEPIALNTRRDRLPAGRMRRPDVPDRRRPAARDALQRRPRSPRGHARRRRNLRRRVGAARHAAHDHRGGGDAGAVADAERRDRRAPRRGASEPSRRRWTTGSRSTTAKPSPTWRRTPTRKTCRRRRGR